MLNDDKGWSAIYRTPVQRLLFLCGLKLVEHSNGKDVWRIRADAYYLKGE